MDYNEVADLISRNSGMYEITTSKGIERRRLFLTAFREICEFAPRSRSRGYELGKEFVSQWLSIKKVERKESNMVAKFQNMPQEPHSLLHLSANALMRTLQKVVMKTD